MVSVNCETKDQYIMPAHSTIVITVNEIDLYDVAIFNEGYSKHYTNLTYKQVCELIVNM